MKCPKCNGKGDYFNEVYNDGKRRREILIKCDMCHGSGEVPMTNEEWLKQCTTEQLAEWIGNVLDEVCDANNYNCKNCFKWCNRNKVVEWLKQPHLTSK